MLLKGYSLALLVGVALAALLQTGAAFPGDLFDSVFNNDGNSQIGNSGSAGGDGGTANSLGAGGPGAPSTFGRNDQAGRVTHGRLSFDNDGSTQIGSTGASGGEGGTSNGAGAGGAGGPATFGRAMHGGRQLVEQVIDLVNGGEGGDGGDGGTGGMGGPGGPGGSASLTSSASSGGSTIGSLFNGNRS